MEKNREILQHAVKNLPRRKADPKSWGVISASLDQLGGSWFMQRNKAGLPTRKAPASAWKGIEQGLQGSAWSASTAFLIKAGAVVVLSAAVVTAVLVLQPEKEPQGPVESTVSVMDNTNAVESPGNSDAPGIEPRPGPIGADPEETSSPAAKMPLPGDNLETGAADHRVTSAISPAEPSNLRASTQSAGDFSGPVQTPVRRLQSSTDVHLPVYHAAATPPVSDEHPVNPPSDPGYYSEKRGFDLSLGGHYAWIRHDQLNLDNMEVPASVSSFGLDLMLERDRVYLLFGLSYLAWEDKATYTFNYNKNELVYAYQYVDSAAFIPETNQVAYFTSEQEVYDSVFHQRPDAIRNQNRVLQIPLVFGYKLYESRRWLFGLNVGLGADINLNNTLYTPVFNEDQASLAGIENHLVYRAPVSWRLMGGAGIHYRMSNHIGLFLEPAYHIYLNAVYPGAEMNNVSYFEVKFGMRYKF